MWKRQSILFLLFTLSYSLQSVRIVEKILGMRLARRPVRRKKTPAVVEASKPEAKEGEVAGKTPEDQETKAKEPTAAEEAPENSEAKANDDPEKMEEQMAKEEESGELQADMKSESEAPKLDAVCPEESQKAADTEPVPAADSAAEMPVDSAVVGNTSVTPQDVTPVTASAELKALELTTADESAKKPDEVVEEGDKVQANSDVEKMDVATDKDASAEVSFEVSFYFFKIEPVGFH